MRTSFVACTAILCALLSCCQLFAQLKTYGDENVSRKVDAEILIRLKENTIQPAEPASAAEFVRRVHLDLLGRIPTSEETRNYLQDSSKDKHHRLVNRLLDHPEMSLFWADMLNLWLNGRDEEPGPGYREFREYLRNGLEENKKWDRFAREMLLPGGDAKAQPAAYFLGRRLKLPREEQLDGMTVAVGSSFFGVRVECAKCHDHPYVAEWKQDHYYGLASFLNRTQLVNKGNKLPLKERTNGEVSFNTTDRVEKKAKVMFLDNKVFADKDNNRRKLLADYALVPENPYFKRAMANRIWKQLMGRGLVNPVDQIHSSNPIRIKLSLNRFLPVA